MKDLTMVDMLAVAGGCPCGCDKDYSESKATQIFAFWMETDCDDFGLVPVFLDRPSEEEWMSMYPA